MCKWLNSQTLELVPIDDDPVVPIGQDQCVRMHSLFDGELPSVPTGQPFSTGQPYYIVTGTLAKSQSQSVGGTSDSEVAPGALSLSPRSC